MKLRKKIKRTTIAVLMALLLNILAFAVYTTYKAYTDLVVEQQQQHLLVISQAVSQNMDLYISGQLRDVEILVRTPGFVEEFQKYYADGSIGGVKEYIISYMLSYHNKGLSRIYLLDRDGKEIFRYNQYPFLKTMLELEASTRRGQTGIGSVFPIEENHYGATLVNIICAGDSYMGVVVGVMDLENLYGQFVTPLDTREIDYIYCQR